MILYYTSDREIRTPDIHHGRRNAVFGPTFAGEGGGNNTKNTVFGAPKGSRSTAINH